MERFPGSEGVREMKATQAQLGVATTGRKRTLGRLGLFMAVALVVGNMIGSGCSRCPGSDIVFKGFVLLMLGVPVYLYMKWRDSRDGSVVEPKADLTPKVTTVGPTAPAKPAHSEPVAV